MDGLIPDSTTAWRRARKCAAQSCVEVGIVGSQIAVRDSKVPGSPILTYTVEEWRVFVEGVKAGDFDDLCASGVA